MEKFDQRNTYQYKLRKSKFDELKKLGSLLVCEKKYVFKRDYGNMLGVLMTKVDPKLILTFAQFYDPTLHYFIFQYCLLAPTLEEFSHIVHIPVRDQAPYMGYVGFPKVDLMAQALHLEKNLVKSNLRTKGNIRGFTLKFLFEKATLFARSESWDALYAMFAILIYGLVLFPNIKGFLDKTSVTIFISINLVPSLLVDVLFSFQKRGGMGNCCIPLLYNWILTHLPRRGPFVDNVGALKWSQRLMSLDVEDVVWYCRDYDVVELIYRCGDFQNVPLVNARGGIVNYHHILLLHQLGYQLKEKFKDKLLEEFLLAEGVEDAYMMKRIRRAWGKVHCIGNCILVESHT
ncbi:uncharacterized protein LOC127135871 [Lathyrus oleraceus]|uniref:uncharacterized protein LOC127135871 n=1 Tax=Pisum sativum TaxID=3888 RepID=UPI0021D1670A|nr:uncharacterized protein LOC127135871 [Pisum sativum]